jgi:transposase
LSENASDRQIGIALGLGMTVDEVAEHLGISRNTVYRHSEKNRLFVDQVRAETEAIASKTIAKRITELESKADIKQRMSAKAYQRLEALLERTEDDGLTLSALKEALDRTEGKAIDRKQIHQLSEHKETVTITHDSAHLDDVLGEMRQLNELRRRYLPAAPETVIEAQVIESSIPS